MRNGTLSEINCRGCNDIVSPAFLLPSLQEAQSCFSVPTGVAPTVPVDLI